MTRVFLADDHALVRQALQGLLGRIGDLVFVGEASTGQETVASVRRLDVDLVLLDVTMPGRGGLETLEELKALRPPPKVLMVTAHLEDEYAVRCMKSGADGYVTKAKGVGELQRAIEKVSSGGKYVSPELAERIAMSFDPGTERAPHERLDNREFEILSRIAQGETLSEIAAALFLSTKTVSSYRTRILKKTGLRNNADIMRYAFERQIVQ